MNMNSGIIDTYLAVSIFIGEVSDETCRRLVSGDVAFSLEGMT